MITVLLGKPTTLGGLSLFHKIYVLKYPITVMMFYCCVLACFINYHNMLRYIAYVFIISYITESSLLLLDFTKYIIIRGLLHKVTSMHTVHLS